MKFLKLAVWLGVFGVSYGLSIGAPWLVLAGLLVPIGLCALLVVQGFFTQR